MPSVLPCYPAIVDALAPVLRADPAAIVAIDGREGVGKTTLGRFLAWTFNVTLIETDLFLIPASDYLIHLDDQVNRIVERRVSMPAPVIAEGVAMRQLMQRIHRVPTFWIWLARPGHASGPLLARRLAAYEAEFSPASRADLVVEIAI